MLGKPSKRLRKKLEESGRRASATVVDIAEKGMAVTSGPEGIVSNTEVVLKTRLLVQPDGEPEFEVTQRFRYPQLAIPSAGSVVPVIYDPEDHDKLIMDDSPEAIQETMLASAGIDQNQIAQLMNQAQQWQSQAGQPGQMPGMAAPAPAATPQADSVAQLEKLAALKDKGALTEAEFQAEKAKILGQ